jgi:hypothetical protein
MHHSVTFETYACQDQACIYAHGVTLGRMIEDAVGEVTRLRTKANAAFQIMVDADYAHMKSVETLTRLSGVQDMIERHNFRTRGHR